MGRKGKQNGPRGGKVQHKLFCRAYGRPGADELCECGASRRAAAEREAARKQTLRGDGVVRVARETQGRKGAGVTVVTGVPLTGKELAALAKELKKKCGGGGKVADGRIEIQGEHRDKLVEELSRRGWTVKKAGG